MRWGIHPKILALLRRYRAMAIALSRRILGADGGAPAVAPVSPPAIAVAAMSPLPDEMLVRDRRSSGRWKVLGPAAVILVAATIGGTLYFRSRQATTRLTEKDTIVLSDFDNKTGDSVFDDTLKQGLSVQLEQSPFLDLLSERKGQ